MSIATYIQIDGSHTDKKLARLRKQYAGLRNRAKVLHGIVWKYSLSTADFDQHALERAQMVVASKFGGDYTVFAHNMMVTPEDMIEAADFLRWQLTKSVDEFTLEHLGEI